jgi:rhodanese-related sulfurtransferase
LTARFAQRPVEYSPHWRVLPHQKLPAEPRSRLGFLITLGRVVLRQAVRPTSPDSQPRLIGPGDVVWFRLRHADAVAIEHPFEAAHEVLRRDRKQFVWGLASTTRLTWRLLRRSGRAQARWREAAPFLTSVAGWCAHLELDHEPGERAHPDARRQARESPLSR